MMWCTKFLPELRCCVLGETRRSVRTSKRELVDAVKTFNTKKEILSQHVLDFDYGIDWDNAKSTEIRVT